MHAHDWLWAMAIHGRGTRGEKILGMESAAVDATVETSADLVELMRMVVMAIVTVIVMLMTITVMMMAVVMAAVMMMVVTMVMMMVVTMVMLMVMEVVVMGHDGIIICSNSTQSIAPPIKLMDETKV